MPGSLSLDDLPERIEIRCRKCDRHGVYRREKLKERFPDMRLPDIARALGDCPGRAPNDQCAVYFTALAERQSG